MAKVEQTVQIAAPIERVFAAITDPRRAQEFTPEIIEIKDFSGDPVGVGTTWTQVVMMANRPANLHMRVVGWDPPHGGAVEISGDQKGRIATACRATPSGTVVHDTVEYEPPGGMLGRMMAGALGGILGRELGRTLARQKEILEGESHGSGTA